MHWAANQIPKASAAVASLAQYDATDMQRDAVSPSTVLAAPGLRKMLSQYPLHYGTPYGVGDERSHRESRVQQTD